MDLLQSIYKLRLLILIDNTKEHIFGHQDSVWSDITQEELMNYKANNGAKEFMEFCRKHNRVPKDKSFGTQWEVLINGDSLTQQIDLEVNKFIYGQELENFLISKGRITTEMFESIN